MQYFDMAVVQQLDFNPMIKTYVFGCHIWTISILFVIAPAIYHVIS